MTGYGRADFSILLNGTINGEGFTVEIKSLNHRFLEVDVKLPERFFPLEMKIRNSVKSIFSRGSVKVYVWSTEGSVKGINADIESAKRYLHAIEKIKTALDLPGDIDIGMLINFRDIFAVGSKCSSDAEEDWEPLKDGLQKAAEEVLKMRRDEGEVIFKDLSDRLNTLDKMVKDIEILSAKAADIYREKVRERISLFLKDIEVDEARLLNEVAIFSEKCCIDEEIVRLKSHISIFKTILVSDEPVGRKMDFLCQEILRELNTAASKSQGVEVLHVLIEARSQLEKIREQVQNVE